MSSLIVLERHLSHLTMTEMKEADKVPFLHALVLAACLLNASRRLGSRLSCDTSSLSAPELRRLSRQIINGQPPRSPDVLKGQQDRGCSRSARRYPFPKRQGPGPRSPWIRHLRNPPEQPGRNSQSRYHWTTPQAASIVSLAARLVLGAKESVFMDPHRPTIAPRCPWGLQCPIESQSPFHQRHCLVLGMVQRSVHFRHLWGGWVVLAVHICKVLQPGWPRLAGRSPFWLSSNLSGSLDQLCSSPSLLGLSISIGTPGVYSGRHPGHWWPSRLTLCLVYSIDSPRLNPTWVLVLSHSTS